MSKVNTVPNQNVIVIKKTPCQSNFLQVNIDEWMQAAKDCDRSFNAFKLYLYFASNEIGYEKALSKEDFARKTGVQKTSFYESLEKLKELGYVKEIGGNRLEFYSSPVRSSGKRKNDSDSAQTEKKIIDMNSALAEKVEKNPISAEAENICDTYGF